MFSVLDFPAEYKVNKVLNKERYFKFTNNTEKEKSFLESTIGDISLLYNIKYKDNTEIAVLYSKVDYPVNAGKFFWHDFAKFIASSLPYKSLLITENLGALKFFVFDGHISSKNSCRKIVTRVYETKEFVKGSRDKDLKCLIENLKSAITDFNTADELYDSWKCYIDEFKHNRHGSETSTNISRDCDYGEISNNILNNLENRIKLDYSCNTLDIENDVEKSEFVKFCKYYSKIVYDESFSFLGDCLEEKSEEWLEDYLCACNQYSNELFKESFDSHILHEIKEYFYSDEEMECPQCADDFNSDEIKSKMGYHYILDSEDFWF